MLEARTAGDVAECHTCIHVATLPYEAKRMSTKRLVNLTAIRAPIMVPLKYCHFCYAICPGGHVLERQSRVR
jgi:hypothetical protein